MMTLLNDVQNDFKVKIREVSNSDVSKNTYHMIHFKFNNFDLYLYLHDIKNDDNNFTFCTFFDNGEKSLKMKKNYCSNETHYLILINIILDEFKVNSVGELYKLLSEDLLSDYLTKTISFPNDSLLNKLDWNKYNDNERFYFDKKFQGKSFIFISMFILISLPLIYFSIGFLIFSCILSFYMFQSLYEWIKSKTLFNYVNKNLTWFDIKSARSLLNKQ